MIQLACHHCGQRYLLAECLAGSITSCDSCQTRFQVPGGSPTAAVDPDEPLQLAPLDDALSSAAAPGLAAASAPPHSPLGQPAATLKKPKRRNRRRTNLVPYVVGSVLLVAVVGLVIMAASQMDGSNSWTWPALGSRWLPYPCPSYLRRRPCGSIPTA